MRRWRLVSWLLAGWTILMLIWAGSYLFDAARVFGRCDDDQLCERIVAQTLGENWIVIAMLWLVGAGILAVVWFATRPRPSRSADELARLEAARVAGLVDDEEYRRRAAQIATGGQTAGATGTRQAPPGSVCGRCAKPLSPVWRDKCQHCGAGYAEFPPQPRGQAASL